MSGWRRRWVFWAALSSGLSGSGSLLCGSKGVLQILVVIMCSTDGDSW
jgi:membrane protein YqaA with SNARE-associated domain